MLFKAIGLDVFFEDDGEQANRRIHRLAREGYAVIFVTERLYGACSEVIHEYSAAAGSHGHPSLGSPASPG